MEAVEFVRLRGSRLAGRCSTGVDSRSAALIRGIGSDDDERRSLIGYISVVGLLDDGGKRKKEIKRRVELPWRWTIEDKKRG